MLHRPQSSADNALPFPHASAAYEAALKHSARVSRLKVLLPICAVAVSLIFIAVAVVRAYVPANLSIASATIEDGKIVMEKPAIAGRNDDGVSYSMTADRALQDIQNPNLITLEKILAAVPMNDIVARVVASSGLFDRSNDKLDMDAPFDINLSNGVQARFQSAQLDINGGTMSTDDPVSILTKDGSIVAQSLRITDKGRSITFAGDVRVKIEATAIKNTDQ